MRHEQPYSNSVGGSGALLRLVLFMILLLASLTGCIPHYSDFVGAQDSKKHTAGDVGSTDNRGADANLGVSAADGPTDVPDEFDHAALADACDADMPDTDGDGRDGQDAQDVPDAQLPWCGDGMCNALETCATCEKDCGSCCPNGECDNEETACSCPEDCDPVCVDGCCTGDENCQSCPQDCACSNAQICVGGSCKSCSPGDMVSCSTNTGECEIGTKECTPQGIWGSCSGVLPTKEICDGEDNDCNGKVDDGNPDGGAVCGSAVGECQKGIETCWGGSLICKGEVSAVDEVCDGKDNSCNGLVDEGLTEDQHEPNEDCGSASGLPELYQDADEPLAISANLYKADGSDDEDWYKIQYSDVSEWIPPCGFGESPNCHVIDVQLTEATGDQDLCVLIDDCENPAVHACTSEGSLSIGWSSIWLVNDDHLVCIQVKGMQTCAPYAVIVTTYSVCPNDGLCPWEDGYVPPQD